MSADPDLLVVGGGPIGLATAIEARLSGLSVAVVEPRQTPIDKACGEGLMPGAVAALGHLGVRVEGHDLAGIAYLSDRLRVEHRFRSGPGRGVRRTVLQEALAVRAAELGVQRVEGKVAGIAQDLTGVAVSGPGLAELRGSWLVACDGLHSTVRRLAGLEQPAVRSGARRFGIRRHFRLRPWSDLVEVHWAAHAEAYVTPVGPELVGIALLGAPGLDFAATLAAVPQLAERLAGAEPDGSVRGAGPLRQRTRRRTSGRILLAGDASGYVDALTGEGLRVGFAQAAAAVKSILAEDPRSYERAWVTKTRDFRMLTSGLVTAARSPLRSRIVPAAAANPAVFGRIVERLAR